MNKYFILLFLILLANFSFGQKDIVLIETQSDATIGIDRKDFLGTGFPSNHSQGYAHDFTLPTSTSSCQKITAIKVEIAITNYQITPGFFHPRVYYNLYYGCSTYAGGATCSPATKLIAEPFYGPNPSSKTFNFGNPLGSPNNPGIVPDFGDNLSVDIIPISIPGNNAVSNGNIIYKYTIKVTVTVIDLPNVTPTFNAVGPICSGEPLIALPTTSNNGVLGTWSPALDNTTTTTYTFTPAASEPCAVSTTLVINVNAATIPIFTPVASICSGEPLIALPTTSNNGVSGTWSPALDNTTTTTYTFTPDASEPCAVSTTLVINVNAVTIPIFSSVASICSGEPLIALPTTSNNGVLGTWSPALDNTTTTTYTFTPDAGGPCAVSTTLVINVNAATIPIFTPVASICSGEPLIALPTTSNNGVSGTWSPALDNTTTTTYTFTPNASEPCAETISIEILVSSIASPVRENFIITENSGNNSIEIISENLGIGDYEFSLDDEFSNYTTNPFFDGFQSGTHVLYIRDKNGCGIVPYVFSILAYPKFFTPNGDGENDFWTIAGFDPAFYSVSKVSIFDRFGKLIHEIEPDSQGWNGDYQGKKLPSNSYWFRVLLTNINGDTIEKLGNFSLIR